MESGSPRIAQARSLVIWRWTWLVLPASLRAASSSKEDVTRINKTRHAAMATPSHAKFFLLMSLLLAAVQPPVYMRGQDPSKRPARKRAGVLGRGTWVQLKNDAAKATIWSRKVR